MSHVTRTKESCHNTHTNESCHPYKWVIAQIPAAIGVGAPTPYTAAAIGVGAPTPIEHSNGVSRADFLTGAADFTLTALPEMSGVPGCKEWEAKGGHEGVPSTSMRRESQAHQ